MSIGKGLVRLLLCVGLCAAFAAASAAESAPDDTLVIATKSAPPFAMRGQDGEWIGMSISLWRAVAGELELDYRFEEASLADMTAGVADGRFDASVAALTITPLREGEVDFSHPFHTTGFAIAVHRDETNWWNMAKSLMSPDFFEAIALLGVLLAFVGACFWLVERRRNAKEFRTGLKGLGDGFWFSAVTMTTTGYGDMAPRTLAGRLLGLTWMFAALIITSTFTAMIASTLTAGRLTLTIQGPRDLPGVTTGSVGHSASDEWLTDRGLAFTPYPSAADGLDAVERGEISAFVYDRALLSYLLTAKERVAVQLVPGSFGRQDYGIALPSGSPLREPLNRALLHYLDDGAWENSLRRWMGDID